MNEHYDVIVLGGGTAGAVAAIAAARSGAATLVVERYGWLGGTAVTGIPFLGMFDGRDQRANGGIGAEIVEGMKREGGSPGPCFGATWNDGAYRFSITPFEQETYKYVVERMLIAAGAQPLYHAYLSGARVRGARLEAVEVVCKSGKLALAADAFIDCTGDADVAYMCGAPMIKKERLQNASTLFKLGGVDMTRFLDALKEGRGVAGWGEWHTRVLMGERAGADRAAPVHIAGHFRLDGGGEVTFTAVSSAEGEVCLNATRTVGVDGGDAESLTRAEISEREHIHALIGQLKTNVPGMDRCHLISTAPIGIRESRNIDGEYVLRLDDVLSGRQFDDSVARGAYPVDIHDPRGGRTQFKFIEGRGSYSIPYRSLIPKGVDNLLVAGRCLSATSEAMGTARIMGAAMAQGEAAGTAAALAARDGGKVRNVDISALQAALRLSGALI